jgi:hypothetical protein
MPDRTSDRIDCAGRKARPSASTRHPSAFAIEGRRAAARVDANPLVVERHGREQAGAAAALVGADLHDRRRRMGDDFELQFLGEIRGIDAGARQDVDELSSGAGWDRQRPGAAQLREEREGAARIHARQPSGVY